jgi:hypothetical protein
MQSTPPQAEEGMLPELTVQQGRTNGLGAQQHGRGKLHGRWLYRVPTWKCMLSDLSELFC